MAYRYNKDLEFLKELSSPELDELVKILTHDKDGKVRFTEELTNNDLYKKHYPDHKEYIELILEEFQKFGGNSILNIFRGGGVLYNEILREISSTQQQFHILSTITKEINLDKNKAIILNQIISWLNSNELKITNLEFEQTKIILSFIDENHFKRALENLNSAFKILDKNEETLNIMLEVIHE